MLSKQFDGWQIGALATFSLVALATIAGVLFSNEYLLAVIPFILIAAFLAIANFKFLFYLLLFAIPFSIEVELGSTAQASVPTEPMMAGMMLVFFIFFLIKLPKLDLKFALHPIILLLGVHVFWIFIASINSVEVIVSLKFWLAKLWYVSVFLFMAAFIINSEREFRRTFWVLFISISLTVLYAWIRHGAVGFTFEDVNAPLRPFYRNHVNYAALLTMFFPFLFVAAKWYPSGSWKRNLLHISKGVFLIAIYFGYTRACLLALVLAAVFYFVVKWKLTKYALSAAVVVIALFVVYLAKDNKYMSYAPDFEKTVYHDSFDDHMEATLALQDASSMERFYRWVAASHMISERPLIGFGPMTFVPIYKSYTVTSFETYLSENEERSTVHNYFIMILVDQGWIGLVIFLILSAAIFIYGERIYHQLSDPNHKRIAMAIIICMLILYVNLVFSDLIETDKTGSLFFLFIAVLVNLHIGLKKDKPKEELVEPAT